MFRSEFLAVIKGKLISVVVVDESSILAFSAASLIVMPFDHYLNQHLDLF